MKTRDVFQSFENTLSRRCLKWTFSHSRTRRVGIVPGLDPTPEGEEVRDGCLQGGQVGVGPVARVLGRSVHDPISEPWETFVVSRVRHHVDLLTADESARCRSAERGLSPSAGAHRGRVTRPPWLQGIHSSGMRVYREACEPVDLSRTTRGLFVAVRLKMWGRFYRPWIPASLLGMETPTGCVWLGRLRRHLMEYRS